MAFGELILQEVALSEHLRPWPPPLSGTPEPSSVLATRSEGQEIDGYADTGGKKGPPPPFSAEPFRYSPLNSQT